MRLPMAFDVFHLLRVHLFDEAEQLRPHVLIFYNAESIAWLERFDVPLQPGDWLDVLFRPSRAASSLTR